MEEYDEIKNRKTKRRYLMGEPRHEIYVTQEGFRVYVPREPTFKTLDGRTVILEIPSGRRSLTWQ